jgi:hypothetical protein
MLLRVGYFLLPVGLLMLFVFGASYNIDTPRYTLLLGGLAILVVGLLIVAKNRPRSSDTGRFRRFRKNKTGSNGSGDEKL